MTKKEKEQIGAIFEALQILSPKHQAYLLGFGEGVLAARDAFGGDAGSETSRKTEQAEERPSA